MMTASTVLLKLLSDLSLESHQLGTSHLLHCRPENDDNISELNTNISIILECDRVSHLNTFDISCKKETMSNVNIRCAFMK